MTTATELPTCPHRHAFHTARPLAERNTRLALVLTALTMVAEIVAGTVYGSMALLADGWHMGTHALALGLAAAAYWAARRYAGDSRFAFGTWKIEVLAAYTSAVMLAGVALAMVWESALRLIQPVVIDFKQAMVVAVIGLVVNLLCLWLLHGAGGHAHGHAHGHGHAHEDEFGHSHGHESAHAHGGHAHAHHGHAHADLNLRSATLHVAADAATSVLALLALVGGMLWGLNWLDPAMGLVGAALIAIWAWGLLRETTRTLLDVTMDDPIVGTIRQAVAEAAPTATLLDLHVWKVGAGRYACTVSLSSGHSLEPHWPPAVGSTSAAVPERRTHQAALVHVSVEVWPVVRPAE